MEAAEMVDNITTKDKKPRKRMKAIFSRIKEQMEFYFSDSNLNRDRYMKKQINESEDGYLSLEVFLKFNKIKELTSDFSVIASALKHSQLLQVSEDGAKVKRASPVSCPKDIDDRTVYVECLPHNVNHEWIKKIFSSCGSVLYVSIPRYKTTGDPKGFAFIEFKSVESALKACKELNNPPAEAGEKPGKFPRTSKQMTHLQKALGHKEDIQTSPEKGLPESPTKSAKKRKRRKTSECSIDGGEFENVTKQQKLEFDNKDQCTDVSQQVTDKKDLNVSKTDESGEKEFGKKKNKKRKKSKGEGQISVTELETSDQLSESERETRKRKKTVNVDTETEPSSKRHKDEKGCVNKENAENESNSMKENETVDEKVVEKKKKRHHKIKHKDIPELRVISKREWMELRTEYLKLQKESMNKLKKTLTKLKKDEKVKESKETEISDAKKSAERPKIEFVPDVIVGITSGKALYRKEVKGDLGTDYQIAYIDIKEGDKSGHIRLKDSDSAKRLAEANSGSYFFTLLKGQEEKDYWNKLESDRDSKFNTKARKEKRGSQKMIEKAQRISKENICKTHIKFDD